MEKPRTMRSGSSEDRNLPRPKRLKPSTEEFSDLSLSGNSFGDYTRLHQGHVNINRVESISLEQPIPSKEVVSGVSEIIRGLHTPLYRDPHGLGRDWYERQTINAFRWIWDEPVVQNTICQGGSPLVIVDETGQAHRSASLALMSELDNQIHTRGFKKSICYNLCDHWDNINFPTVLQNLLTSLISQNEDLVPELRDIASSSRACLSPSRDISDFLLDLFFSLLEKLRISECYIFLESVDAYTTTCRTKTFNAIVTRTIPGVKLTWVLFSKTNCAHSLGSLATAFKITFGQTFSALQLNYVCDTIRSSTDLKNLGLAKEGQFPDLKYTKEGWKWLSSRQPSTLVCERVDMIQPDPGPSELVNQFDISSQIFELSGHRVAQAHVVLPTTGQSLEMMTNNFVCDVYFQLAYYINEDKFLFQDYLIQLPHDHRATLVSAASSSLDQKPPPDLLVKLLYQLHNYAEISTLIFLSLPPALSSDIIRLILEIPNLLPARYPWKVLATASSLHMNWIDARIKEGGSKVPIVTVHTEFEEYLQSLFFEGMNEIKRQIQDALPGSNEWIWTNTTFREWNQKAGLLWISGPPGTGKSVLCKTILRRFTSEVNGQTHTCAWFYSARELRRGTSHVYMLRAILRSILTTSPESFPATREFYRHRFRMSRMGVIWQDEDGNALATMLREIAVDARTAPTLLILDGLDEFLGSQSEQFDVKAFLELLSFLAYTKGSRMWLITCSRPVPEFRSEFLDCFHIPIHRNNSEDITIIVDHGIASLRTLWPHRQRKRGGKARYLYNFNQALFKEPERLGAAEELELELLKDHLISQSLGSIIWIKLIFSEVELLIDRKEGFTVAQLRAKIQSLPRDLQALYREIVSRLKLEQDPEKCNMSRKIFLWVTGSPEWGPLQLQGLREGLAMPDNYQACTEMDSFDTLQMNLHQIGEDWEYFYSVIYAHCGGLVELIPPTEPSDCVTSRVEEMGAGWIVHLIHHTAKSFLESMDETSPLHVVETDAIQFVSTQSAWFLTLAFPPECSRGIVNGAEGSAYQYQLCPRSHSSLRLQSCTDIPDSVTQRLEGLMQRFTSSPLTLFALKILRSGGTDSIWLSTQISPDFLIWWVRYIPIPPESSRTAVDLSAYLCSPRLMDILAQVLKCRQVLSRVSALDHNMMRGLEYGTSLAGLQLQADIADYSKLDKASEDLIHPLSDNPSGRADSVSESRIMSHGLSEPAEYSVTTWTGHEVMIMEYPWGDPALCTPSSESMFWSVVPEDNADISHDLLCIGGFASIDI